MTIIFPKNNLPEPAQPWAREVQKQLSNVVASDRANEINNSARDNQLNSSLISLTKVVSDVKIVANQASQAAEDAADAADDAAAAASTANTAINGLLGLGSTGSGYTINVSNITSGGVRDGVLNLTSGSNSSIQLFNGGVDINGPSAEVRVGTAGNGGTTIEGSLFLNGRVYAPNLNAASTNIANVRRNQGGGAGEVVVTNQSSIRFKKDVVDLVSVEELNPKKLLDLPVRAFKYKDDYPIAETDSRYGQLIPGFIAEEVDEFYPIGADHEDGESNLVESWNERVILPAMLALIQELYARIEILENATGTDKVE